MLVLLVLAGEVIDIRDIDSIADKGMNVVNDNDRWLGGWDFCTCVDVDFDASFVADLLRLMLANVDVVVVVASFDLVWS